MFATRKSLVWIVAALLLLAVPVAAQDATTPTIEVSNQAFEDGMVTIDRVVSDGPGWVVIHADDNGSPGQVLGQSAVTDGENTDVQVEVDTDGATETLHAMLHADLGVEGTFEFPGADTPVQVDGQVVLASFTVTGLLQMQETATPTVEATATPETAVDATATPEVVVGAQETPTLQPETLPETGGSSTPWTPILLVGAGLALLVVGSLLAARRRPADIDIRD